jgi:hypothetical protein
VDLVAVAILSTFVFSSFPRVSPCPRHLTSFQVNLLVQIANDCYKCGAFYFAAKAFDLLEKLDGNPEFWDGKRGACAGVLQAVLAGRCVDRTPPSPNMCHCIRVIRFFCISFALLLASHSCPRNRSLLLGSPQAEARVLARRVFDAALERRQSASGIDDARH